MKKVIQEIRKFYNNDPKSKFKYTEKDELWRNLDRVGEDVMVNDSNLYESSLHPIIRFIHKQNIVRMLINYFQYCFQIIA